MSLLNSRYRSRQAEVEKLKQAHAEPPTPIAPLRTAVATSWRALRAAVVAARKTGAWIVHRRLVWPKPIEGDVAPLPRRTVSEAPTPERVLPQSQTRPVLPPDPHGFAQMSEADLVALGNNVMPLHVRRELEAEQTHRAARPNPPPMTIEQEARLRADAHDEVLAKAGLRTSKWWMQ